MIYLFLLLGLVLLLYTVLPNYVARNRTKSIIKKLPRNDQEQTITLTFDDGPDDQYTEKVLDILKFFEIQATFFLVATKAQENKDIIERMHKEGHQIAMHSYKHKSAWLSFPHETILDFKKSMDIFRDLNLEILLFRPPWGTFNILTLGCAKKYGLKVVLWSVNAADWKKHRSSKMIADSITKQVKNKDIIVLHDSGGDYLAPRNTIDALQLFIPKLLEKGYRFVPVPVNKGSDHEHTFKNNE